MMLFFIRLLLAVVLTCDFLIPDKGVGDCVILPETTNNEEQIRCRDHLINDVAEEPQSPFNTVFRTSRPIHRLASSRSVRLLLSGGGKPGHQHGRFGANSLSHTFKNIFHMLWYVHLRPTTAFASPRYYYVIALRRILC